MGRRVYFDAGGVTLQVVQADTPQLAAKALYFAVADIDAVHARAAGLGCLSGELVHGMAAGDPLVRPWGNPLCFVEEGTIYAG